MKSGRSGALCISVFAMMLMLSFNVKAESDDTNVLLVPNEKDAPAISSERQDVQVTFDPSEVTESVKDFDREKFIRESMDKMNQEPSTEKIEMWTGPRSQEHLDKLSLLSDAEISAFLGKKQAFLNKFAKTLAFFHLSPRKINKVLMELNNRFYESSHVISRSNTKGGTMMFSISAGLALPQKIVQSLKQRSIGKYIPESGGFLYMLGFGVGFSRQVDENKKSKFVFEIFMDVERLKSTMTGLLEVSAAGTYGLVFEKREASFTHQKSGTTYGGLAGVFRQGQNQFGWSASTGMSLPPGIGAVLVYQDEATRYYLFRTENLKATFPALRMIKENVLSYLKNLVGNKPYVITCNQALF
ncbi:hypothetical protein [Bdellovibrio bacteriovorus]|uniref:hypothetical protein n=1 Tax=Bdellovibrio bacteriovorus TaxID=959 RepID=UPI0035A95633